MFCQQGWKAVLVKHLFVFKDLLVAPSQLFSSWSIKEKTPFSKAGLVSFLQTNLATEVGLLQNYSCTFFLTSNQLSGLRQQPQHCMDCSLNLRLQQVSGSCPIKIIYYQSGLFRSLLFSKWITQNLGILLLIPQLTHFHPDSGEGLKLSIPQTCVLGMHFLCPCNLPTTIPPAFQRRSGILGLRARFHVRPRTQLGIIRNVFLVLQADASD